MRWTARFRGLLRFLFRRRQAEADLESEFRYHMQQEIESNIRAGMSPEEATFAAQRLTGSTALYKEECRDARATAPLESCTRDLRYATRTLRHTPLFTTVAITTLALGIGANTTVFTFIENILLRSLPVRDPQQLVSLNWGGMVNISYPNYIDFRDRNQAFSSLIAYRYNPVNISVHARENFRVWGYEATGNYFETLGIKPLLGRFFGSADDDKPGAHPVLVISYRSWQSRFAADPNVIGRTVRVNSFPFTIIGVAPQYFDGTEFITSADYWTPMSMELQIEPGNDWLHSRGSQEVWVMGRLKAGISRAQAEANLDQIAQQLAGIYPKDINRKDKFHLTRPGLIGQALRGPVTGFGIVLMSVAALVLLLACVNLAAMLSARASDRRHEIGIRLAIGASRMQLLRQLMIESLLLALTGGLFAYALAFGACRLFSSWHPDFDLPIRTALHPNTAVLCFTIAVAFCTTIFFGFIPALQAVRTDLNATLKNEPASNRFRRWSLRDVLVAGQIAVSVVLVISSVLVVRSLQHALTLNLGFDPNHAVSVSFDLGLQGYKKDRARRFDAELLQKAASIPGVESAGIINNMPLRTGENNDVISRADRPLPPPSEQRAAVIYKISPGYLRTARTRLLVGRDFDQHDRQGAPLVVIVNDALIRVLFGKQEALGQHFRLGNRIVQIVGVVETGKYEYLGEDPHPAVFLPLAQSGTGWTTLIARTALPAQAATELLRKTVLDLDPQLTLFNVGSLKDQLALPLFPARIAAIVLGIFGVLAMVLAATGLFALMAYAVSRRRREIGIRMALGAQRIQVLSSIFRRTVALCALGISVGTIVTLAAARLLSAVLYGVSPHDPATYATAILLLIAVALLACWNPAARAIRIDPARTLREQ